MSIGSGNSNSCSMYCSMSSNRSSNRIYFAGRMAIIKMVKMMMMIIIMIMTIILNGCLIWSED